MSTTPCRESSSPATGSPGHSGRGARWPRAWRPRPPRGRPKQPRGLRPRSRCGSPGGSPETASFGVRPRGIVSMGRKRRRPSVRDLGEASGLTTLRRTQGGHRPYDVDEVLALQARRQLPILRQYASEEVGQAPGGHLDRGGCAPTPSQHWPQAWRAAYAMLGEPASAENAAQSAAERGVRKLPREIGSSR